MVKNNTSEVKTKQKVQTKYERKIAERKKKEEQDKRSEKKFKIVSRIVFTVIIVGIVAGIVVPIYIRYQKTNNPYIEIGNRKVTELQYDYYYNATVNSYLTTYSSVIPYLGLDVTKDFAQQPYSDQLSWKDMFDRMTVARIREMCALSQQADQDGFAYDIESEYAEYKANLENEAETMGVSLSNYYESSFGPYATVKDMEPIIKEELRTAAFYEELIARNVPSDEEITTYYNENKINYDKVDYRSFVFSADVLENATEEEISTAMEDLKQKADAFVTERKGGADFEELCILNAPDDAKANYENTETEYSLSEGRYSTELPDAIVDWVYDEGRVEGDIAAIKSEADNQYYVVEFIQKYFDEADNDRISNLLAGNTVSESINKWIEAFPVNDISGDLKYLTVETATEATEE